jgi:hypothetical protein
MYDESERIVKEANVDCFKVLCQHKEHVHYLDIRRYNLYRSPSIVG